MISVKDMIDNWENNENIKHANGNSHNIEIPESTINVKEMAENKDINNIYGGKSREEALKNLKASYDARDNKRKSDKFKREIKNAPWKNTYDKDINMNIDEMKDLLGIFDLTDNQIANNSYNSLLMIAKYGVANPGKGAVKKYTDQYDAFNQVGGEAKLKEYIDLRKTLKAKMNQWENEKPVISLTEDSELQKEIAQNLSDRFLFVDKFKDIVYEITRSIYQGELTEKEREEYIREMFPGGEPKEGFVDHFHEQELIAYKAKIDGAVQEVIIENQVNPIKGLYFGMDELTKDRLNAYLLKKFFDKIGDYDISKFEENVKPLHKEQIEWFNNQYDPDDISAFFDDSYTIDLASLIAVAYSGRPHKDVGERVKELSDHTRKYL